MGMKQSFFFLKTKIQNGGLKKSAFFKIANSQYLFVKISWIGPWDQKILRIGNFEKRTFFELAVLNFVFQNKKIFFCFISMKISQRFLDIKILMITLVSSQKQPTPNILGGV